jgi:hypothetical protein
VRRDVVIDFLAESANGQPTRWREERRLAAVGERRDRAPVPVDELPHLAPEDREAGRVIDAVLQSRAEAGQSRDAAIAEFVRDAAYTWANRLLALRCMEARSLIDEIILEKDAYGGRSLQHDRLAKKRPERCAGEDEGLFAGLFDEFARCAEELPLLFEVIALGFASPVLDKLAAKEPLDKWTYRDGRARPPETRDAFLMQERRYDPDLNDGVRVNIARRCSAPACSRRTCLRRRTSRRRSPTGRSGARTSGAGAARGSSRSRAGGLPRSLKRGRRDVEAQTAQRR